MDRKVLVYQTKTLVRIEAGATAVPKDDDIKEAQSRFLAAGRYRSIHARNGSECYASLALAAGLFYDPKMHGVDWEGRMETIRLVG